MTAAIAAIILLVGVGGVAVGVMVAAYLRQRVDWKPLPGTSAKYTSLTKDVTETEIAQAYVDAMVLLRRYTDFTPTTLTKMANSLHIAVQAVEKWESPQHGGTVAGVSSGYGVYVDRHMKALLHEMAHVAEFLEGIQDFEHRTWVKRGIQKAADEYAALRTVL